MPALSSYMVGHRCVASVLRRMSREAKQGGLLDGLRGIDSVSPEQSELWTPGKESVGDRDTPCVRWASIQSIEEPVSYGANLNHNAGAAFTQPVRDVITMVLSLCTAQRYGVAGYDPEMEQAGEASHLGWYAKIRDAIARNDSGLPDLSMDGTLSEPVRFSLAAPDEVSLSYFVSEISIILPGKSYHPGAWSGSG